MEKKIYGVAFNGDGKFKSLGENGKVNKVYNCWHNMLTRCYSNTMPSYDGCTVCEEWLDFQNFAKWYEENYYEIEGESVQLDKDILVKGNKVYSPSTCVFVPQAINLIFATKSNNNATGVCRDRGKKYVARCWDGEKLIHLGSYTTNFKAFSRYKKYKEDAIKELAELYKDRIPQKLYDTMMNYKLDYYNNISWDDLENEIHSLVEKVKILEKEMNGVASFYLDKDINIHSTSINDKGK